MYIFELVTVQTQPFRNLFESLKEILPDTNMILDETGLKISAINSKKSMFVHLKLDAKKFDKYYCKNKCIVGLSLVNLFKLIKTSTNNDTLTLYIDDHNTNLLCVKIQNNDKNKTTEYELNLMDLNEETIAVPPADFESIIIMPSVDFYKICRDMNGISDKIEIKSVGNQLIFSSCGDAIKQKTIFGQGAEGINFEKSPDSDDLIIQGYYDLKELTIFTKCSSLCNNISICMKNNYPIILIFAVGNLGELKLALAPRTKK